MATIGLKAAEFRKVLRRGAALSGGCLLVCAMAALCAGVVRSQAAGAGVKATAAGQSKPGGQAAESAAGEQSDQAAEEDDPSPGNFLGSTYVPSVPAARNGAGGNESAAVAAAPPPPKPTPADAGGDAARQEINNETANLLEMAYALKSEMDRTSRDELSITVVRKANQIEQLARKMRGEMRPAISRN